MDNTWIEYIPWVYASIQCLITLTVSIIGVKYVRTEFLLQKSALKQQTELTLNINEAQEISGNVVIEDEIDDTEKESLELERVRTTYCIREIFDNDDFQNTSEEHKEIEIKATTVEPEDIMRMSKMGFCKLWFKVVWKMRGIYCSLGVHVFDVLTDILVIISWFSFPNVSGDGVDPLVMAYSAIAALLFHKTISIIAFWAKEQNILRCVLQFFDLLIFEEIYLSHQRIITQFRNKSNALNKKVDDDDDSKSQDAIETTTTFKYVRNLEAIFESIPQSILQLVFIMRTSWQSEGSGIFFITSIASIIQSVISMTNSVLSNDNIYMSASKWKKHKQRLPPTLPFLKHFIARLSEVIYRICLCALFWVVCGGLPFAIMIAVEVAFLIIMVILWDVLERQNDLSIDDLCLRIQALIVMPSELVYALESGSFDLGEDAFFGPINNWGDCVMRNCCYGCLGSCFFICTCCAGPATLLSTLCSLRRNHYIHMTIRIGISMMEWTLLIIWPLLLDETRYQYLYSTDYGFIILIISLVCFLIFTQYQSLFPNFALPYNIPIRSHFGYAFNGELEELQRVTIPTPPSRNVFFWSDDPSKSHVNMKEGSEHYDLVTMVFFGELTKLKQRAEIMDYDNSDFQRIDEQNEYGPLSMIALSNKQYTMVKWLEDEMDTQNVEAKWRCYYYRKQYQFENMDHLFARHYLQPDYSSESSLWEMPYSGADDNRYASCVTPLMLALSNEQYHVVDWLVNEKKVKLPTVLFNNQRIHRHDSMDYYFARDYIQYYSNWTDNDDSREWWCCGENKTNNNIGVITFCCGLV